MNRWLGTALLFLPTFFAMLIAAGAKLRHMALIAVIGAAMAPAKAASAMPTANTSAKSRGMLTPSDAAISRLLLPARIIMPMRVF